MPIKSLFFLMLSFLLFYGCAKQTQSIRESISCYTAYESLSIELRNFETGDASLLEPNDAGQVDFGDLKEGSYEVYVETFTSDVDHPTVQYTRRFNIPKNNGEPLLALPEPLQVEDVDYSIESGNSFAHVTFASSQCRSILDGNIYVSKDSPVLLIEENKIYNGDFSNSYNSRIEMDEPLLYAVFESIYEINDRSIITRTAEIELYKYGSINSQLKLGEITQFTIPEGESTNFFFLAENGKYYLVDLFDSANADLSGQVLVVSAKNYFQEARTEYPKGAGMPLKASSDGIIDIEAAVAFEGKHGEFAIRVTEIDTSQAVPWQTLYSFSDPSSVQFSRRNLVAGSYTLSGQLLGALPGMVVYYSLFSSLDNEFNKGIVNGQYKIGPGITGSNPMQVGFVLEQDQEVLLFMNSAYYGNPNTLKIDLFE